MRVKIADKELFNISFNEMITGLGNIKSKGLCIDSRHVQKGDIFFALKGEVTDGHNYINEAYKSGACMAIVEESIEHKLPIYKVPSVRKFIKKLSSKYRNLLSHPIIGITGSNGKTTTKDMLVNILSNSMDTSFSKGNYNSTLGAPLSLFECHKKNDITAIEMGASKPGEIEYICNIVKPDMGIITNISGAHLKNFQTIKEIMKTKSALFNKLPGNGTAFVNLDDYYIKNLSIFSKKITYSFDKDSNYSAQLSADKKQIKINNIDINIKHASKIMATNVLAAFAIASTIGVEESKIKESIENFEITNGRGNILTFKGISLINDTYNANLESAKNGIENLVNNFANNRKIVVIGDMLELGPFKIKHHEKLGEILLEKKIDAIFSYGELTKYTRNVLKKRNQINKHYIDKNNLISDLKIFLQKGDAIYLKGSRGMKMESIIEGLKA